MSYNYQTEKSEIFHPDWQVNFLKIRDNIQQLLNVAGAVRMDKAIKGITGSVWTMMACVDRLVELGELREITNGNCPGQYRIFISGKE